MLTDLCIYTIKHSDDLRASEASGGRGTYTEGRRWVSAKKMVDAARRSRKRVPIIFAPAEATRYLLAWALLDEVILGEGTTYTFSELRLFDDPRPRKASLRVDRTGELLDENFIRPYAICRTPRYLEDLEPG